MEAFVARAAAVVLAAIASGPGLSKSGAGLFEAYDIVGSDPGVKQSVSQDSVSQDEAERRVVATTTLAAGTFALGEPILVHFALRNDQDRPVTIWLSGFWPNHFVMVRDSAGSEPPLTAAGKQRREAFAPGGSRTKNIPLVLNPGDTYQDDAIADLGKLYILSAGDYTVQVTYEDKQPPTPLRAASAPAPFRVVARS